MKITFQFEPGKQQVIENWDYRVPFRFETFIAADNTPYYIHDIKWLHEVIADITIWHPVIILHD